MKHLRILTYVDEVARSRSIRKAAEHLNVTASAVNRRITDLEAELGAQLFERLPRGINEFRKAHPLVEFDVRVVDHEIAMSALAAFEVDLALVFRPSFVANF